MSDSWRRWLRQLASLRLAVVVLGLLAAVLAAATIYESVYGTPAAQRDIYGSWWFALILLVLGINVAAATISRWPWRARHVGFVVTHAAILLILGGCLTTHWGGVNGRVTILQGRQEDRVLQDDWALVVLGKDDTQPARAIVPISPPPRVNSIQHFTVDGQAYQMRIAQYMPNALAHGQMVDGSQTDPAGMQVEMQFAGRTMSQWLFVDDTSNEWSVRMPGFSLVAASKFAPPAVPADMPTKGRILALVDGKEYTVDVEQAMRQGVPVGDGRTMLRVAQYYERADVGSGKLSENPQHEVNPAVAVELVTGERVEKRIVFARFGDVTTMRPGSQVGPVQLAYQHAGAAQSDVNLTIVPQQGKLVLYEATGKGLLQQVDMPAGEPVPLKNLKMSLTVKEFRPHARMTTVVEPVTEPAENPQPAVDVELTGPGLQHRGWLVWGQVRTLSPGPEALRMVLQPKQVTLPFAIRLNRFDLETYPGTQMPSMYRSNVTVLDQRTDEERTVNIEMNRPLEYGGWTFFQSSYSLADGRRVTILSASRDPGKPVVYLGAILLVIGTVIFAIQRFVTLGRMGAGAGRGGLCPCATMVGAGAPSSDGTPQAGSPPA